MSKALASKKGLPSKEAGLFRELLNLYETRLLKKGLKTADQILKKFPEHGETICMKGLVLVHLGRREEGIDLVKKGVRLDLTSHIVWHVFGLIQKGEKNYEEALKSYGQALRFDKPAQENVNILRDSANLQTHLRIFDALVETRYTLLRLRPNLRQHWIALSVAHYLNGNLKEAKKVLENYESTLKNVPAHDVEHSETLLFYIRILEELGDYTEALTVLNTNSKSRAIVDQTAISETRARLLSKLESPEAEEAWHTLLERNPDCYTYYTGYLSSKGLPDLSAPNPSALSVVTSLSTEFPRAAAPKRLALTLSSGEEFKALAEPYITTGLSKGIPSLFSDLKSLYRDAEKRDVIEEIAERLKLKYAEETSSPSSPEEPTTYLWTLYLLAQHHSFLGRHAKALSILDEALEHTPTLPELHTFKGRVLKRAGDYYGAAKSVNEARLLDGQDRFLNTKTGKYLLRAGMVQEAGEVFGLFTKKDAESPGADLQDMQSMLYLLEEAKAQEKNGKPNLAVKKYIAVKKIFDEVEEDQYDFHGYNLRKFTLNAYIDLVNWEDRLRSQPAYVTAALSASRIFVAAHDDPELVKSLSASPGLTASAKKAAKKKAAKKAAAAKAIEDMKKPNQQQNSNEDKGLEPPPPKDEDPDGLKLLASPDVLDQAAKLLQPLASLAAQNIDVWLTTYDVAIRRGKLLQAVGALDKAKKLDGEHPEVHVRVVDLKFRASKLPEDKAPSEPVKSLFEEALSKLCPPTEVSLETFNSQFLQKRSSEPEAVIAAAKVLKNLEAPVVEVENVLFGLVAPESGLSVKNALTAVQLLQDIKSTRLEEFRAACDARFELSTAFKPEAELVAIREKVVKKRSSADSAEASAEAAPTIAA
ncbi:hypothetical protein MD484_g1411, partial [Candolleomyces efflorescens]